MKKKCTKCKKVKDISKFFKDKRVKDGLYSACKKCHQVFTKKWEENNKNWRRKYNGEYIGDWKKENDGNKWARKWNKKYPERAYAHYLLSRAIKVRKIKRLSCKICGGKKSHGHHPDYSKPLKVIWLCAFHHKQLHLLENNKLD